MQKGCDRIREIAILPQFLAVEPHFVRNGSADPRNRNFTSGFGDRTSFRAKRLRPDERNRNFIPVFGDRTSFRAKRLRPDKRNRNFTVRIQRGTEDNWFNIRELYHQTAFVGCGWCRCCRIDDTCISKKTCNCYDNIYFFTSAKRNIFAEEKPKKSFSNRIYALNAETFKR